MFRDFCTRDTCYMKSNASPKRVIADWSAIRIVAAILIILGIWCGMRKHAWSDVRGHSRDYMAKRARRRGRLEKDGAIQLDEYDRSGQDAFSDEVSSHSPKT